MAPNMPRQARLASLRVGLIPTRGAKMGLSRPPAGTKAALAHCEYVKIRSGMWGMSPGEAAAGYRLYAAYCAEIAQTVTDSARKVALLDMAQAWAKLAELADKDSPPAREAPT